MINEKQQNAKVKIFRGRKSVSFDFYILHFTFYILHFTFYATGILALWDILFQVHPSWDIFRFKLPGLSHKLNFEN